MGSIRPLLSKAIEHHQAGRLAEAEAMYQDILKVEPSQADVLHLLGLVAHKCGKGALAEELLRWAICKVPANAAFHNSLGIVLRERRHFVVAIGSYGRAISLEPNSAETYNNLGNALKDYGQLATAIANFKIALTLRPEYAEAHNNFGLAQQVQSDFAVAERLYGQALILRPDYPEAYFNLGNVKQAQGRLNVAVTLYQKALKFKPEYPEAHSNLGIVLKDLGQLDEAIACLKMALTFQPGMAGTICSLGNVFVLTGYHGKAIACFRKALQIAPDYAGAHSNLLLAMQYLTTPEQAETPREQECFAARHEDSIKLNWPTHSNCRQVNRRLRVGYVSPNFNRHSVAYFLEPILANHDRGSLEIFCYHNSTLEDSVTKRFISLSGHWLNCVSMTDIQLAQRITSDGIDILIDLAGHTASNRLTVFARKPAPIQISYLGYPSSTGLTAIDYRLTDIYADPPSDDDTQYSEKLLRLPKSFLCYCPPSDAPAVNESPAKKNGFVTYGSFNALQKISPAAISCWSRILLAQPGSKMILKTAGLGSIEARRHLLGLFNQHGISAARLDLLPQDDNFRRHLSRYQDVDICLDSFPYNGTTTTCEALWMGVPTITLRGDRHASRVGASLLSNCGLGELIAHNHDEYLLIAERLANEPDRLANLRRGLRQKLGNSPLLDGPGLTMTIESVYKDIWSTWCVGPFGHTSDILG